MERRGCDEEDIPGQWPSTCKGMGLCMGRRRGLWSREGTVSQGSLSKGVGFTRRQGRLVSWGARSLTGCYVEHRWERTKAGSQEACREQGPN